MRRSHVEQRSRRYAARQHVADTHNDKRDAQDRRSKKSRFFKAADDEARECTPSDEG